MTQILKLSELEFVDELHPRTGVWWVTVHRYAKEMEAGAVFPHILVGRLPNGRTIVVDGWHRCLALQKLGEEHVKGEVKDYPDERRLYAEAVRANNHHGKPLSVQEKVRIIYRLEEYGFEPQEIGRLIYVSPGAEMERFKARTVKGPRGVIHLKSPLAKLVERGLISESDAAAMDQGSLTVRDVQSLLIQLVALLHGYVFPWKDPTIKALAVEAYQLLGEGISILDVSPGRTGPARTPTEVVAGWGGKIDV